MCAELFVCVTRDVLLDEAAVALGEERELHAGALAILAEARPFTDDLTLGVDDLLRAGELELEAHALLVEVRFDLADLFYSFGVANPGAVRLFNYPRALQNLVRDNGERFDVGTIDIVRDRERGVPRYNEFRRWLHKRPVTSFDELTDNPAWAEAISRVYDNDLEKVDTMVGLLAEPLPQGFGFSDTAFRVFLLMASRRLKSDRFLSKDYRAEIYTKEGIEWVEETSMIDVITRHFPGLAGAMEGLDNAFKPWQSRQDT